MSNGNGIEPWAKSWAALGATGVLAAIAGYLVWANVTTSQVSAVEFRRTQQALEQHVRDSAVESDIMRGILRQICVNTAETTSDRTRCFIRVE